MHSHPVAVVTGASRGIGKAIALRLAEAGYSIIAISRTIKSEGETAGLDHLQPLVEKSSVEYLPLALDISDTKRHHECIEQILDHWGRIDLLVNNAGVAPLERLDILETTEKSYDRVTGINLRGPFFFTQSIAREMLGMAEQIPSYHPKIIFITSLSAEVSSTNRAEYCISKAGLSMAAKVFADRLASTSIKVFEIRPGIIQTDMTAGVKEKYDTLIGEGLVPQGRWGYPDDIASAVLALAGGGFDFATGSIFEISGGMNIRRL